MNPTGWISRIAALTIGCAVLHTPLAGCARAFREELLEQRIAGATAPKWVTGCPQDRGTPNEVFFVGRSVGYTVLDEHAAVAAAREDVREQLAQFISTRVFKESRDRDARANGDTGFPGQASGLWGVNWQFGRDRAFFTPFDDHRLVRFLPGRELQQEIERQGWLFTSALAGDLVDRDVYFEKWEVRDEPARLFGRAHRGLTRYKCWVLMSIPREKLNLRVGEFREAVKDAYERYQQDRDRAIARAEENRKLRIRREEENRLWEREDQAQDRTEARQLRSRLMSATTGVMFEVSDQH